MRICLKRFIVAVPCMATTLVRLETLHLDFLSEKVTNGILKQILYRYDEIEYLDANAHDWQRVDAKA